MYDIHRKLLDCGNRATKKETTMKKFLLFVGFIVAVAATMAASFFSPNAFIALGASMTGVGIINFFLDLLFKQ